jgi:hypothetical protein
LKRIVFAGLIFFSVLLVGYPQTQSNPISQGKDLFQTGSYREALSQFRQVLTDPEFTDLRGDAYFWTAKTLIALDRFSEADQNLEYFLTRHSENRNIPEAEYLRARIHFLEHNFEAAVQLFAKFVRNHQRSPFVPNAYYWTGESLFSLGRYEEAKDFFQVIVDRFQASSRYDAARYRIDVITLKEREEELLTLLQWVQEESLKNLNDFRLRESTYEQALSSIGQDQNSQNQNQSSELQRTQREKELEIQLDQLKNQFSQTDARLRSLNSDYQRVLTNLEISQRRIGELELQLENRDFEDVSSQNDTLQLREELLDLKEETLQLMVDLIESHGEVQ